MSLWPGSAITGLMQRSKLRSYLITSSARPSSVISKAMPSAFAVSRLMMNSILVG